MRAATFASVNLPVCTLGVSVNLFLAFSMLFPQQGTERLKRPLNVLLGSLVVYNISLQVCVFLYALTEIRVFKVCDICYAVLVECIYFNMRTSMSSHLWLNVFYYCQIVPAQRSLFIWLKKNIRVFMYSALITDKVCLLFGFSVGMSFGAINIELDEYFAEADINSTYSQWNAIHEKMDTVMYVLHVDLWMRLVYFLLSLSVMLASSCSTVLYLRTHMKNMEKSSSGAFSSPRLQRQIRVTITGIIQIVLYSLCSAFMIVREILVSLAHLELDSNGYLFCTTICLYCLGTTINLVVGQTIFRQRASHILQTCLETLKFISN